MKYSISKPSLVFIIFNLLVGCLNSSTKNNEPLDDQSISTKNSINRLRLKTVHGDILIDLNYSKAPLTSARVLSLANAGFYQGLTFHRVIDGHIIQTGDPSGTGEGGSGQNIPFENSEIKHVAGTVSMARRSNDLNSADSQFFICLKKNSELDGAYASFGKVVEGIDVAKKIVQGDKIISLTVED